MSVLSFILNAAARPSVWLHYKSRSARIAFRSRLPPSAKVLEIGSGHNPWFRSNVLCDRFLTDDTERGGKLRAARPLIVADACNLPFPDNSFDFVYASHVAEHIDRLEDFFREIQRVAPAGYIETPNYIFEQTVGTTTHCWAFRVEGDTLCAERKWVAGAPARAYHGMHAAVNRNPLLALAHILIPELRVVRFWWKRPMKFRLCPAPEPLGPTKAHDSAGP